MVRIVETALEYRIPLEVNMLGFVEKRNYPCDRFFGMVAQMGAKFVIGCDAHKPEMLNPPEAVPGFMEFLGRYGISPADNVINLPAP